LLIPASSVKGAIAHRTAYYYNKRSGVFADTLKDGDSIENHIGNKNEAVLALFGSEGEKSDKDKTKTVHKKRGNVLFSDVIKCRKDTDKEKVLNHVAIDRFTGGAIDGALFAEETLYAKEENIKLHIMVNKSAFSKNEIQLAFEDALKDICKGMQPLGGGVNRGNGIFYGKLYKEGEIVYEY
jgi:CRISPR/Cas system CSM-associated protein Csm3 (group 7 of RAMP superfamily)